MTTPENAPVPATDTATAPAAASAPDEPTGVTPSDEAQRETEQTVRSLRRLEEQN